MQESDPRISLSYSSIHSELLLRISRELDRFMIKLMQVEGFVSELMDSNPDALSADAAASLQNFDYLSQVAISLSMLLNRIAVDPDKDIGEFLSDVKPTDLCERLNDRLLRDIDNLDNDYVVF